MSSNIPYSKTDFGFQFPYCLHGKNYQVEIHYPNSQSSYHIPYILVLPQQLDEECFLAVEINNLETENQQELLMNGLLTARNLIAKLEGVNTPVLVPILPSVHDKVPYFQQLSRETFDMEEDSPYYRVDLQVLNMINEVKQNISTLTKIDQQIFLNGYSSSGVFAQRFALLHPEIVKMACIGGASGSIPVPSASLEYPLGIKDFSTITGKNFNMEDYKKVKFRYYVGELEDVRKTNERFDEDGKNAPMHDMSYFDRSVPSTVGYQQRKLFGKNLLERSRRQVFLLSSMGIDIIQQILVGRAHNNQSGIGVNELGDEIIRNCYQENLQQAKQL